MLNKFGAVNLDYMTGLVDMSEENLIQSLEGHIYYNPSVENYEIKDRFIAGNVVQKSPRMSRHGLTAKKNVSKTSPDMTHRAIYRYGAGFSQST